jgi:hypothetical protein
MLVSRRLFVCPLRALNNQDSLDYSTCLCHSLYMKKLTRISAFALFLLSFIASSNAQACYTSREREAEQGLRIHSELMIIGLTCIKTQQGQDLYNKYQRFTRQNSDLLSKYETDLINYYSTEGVSSPEKKLNTLRTSIANEISGRVSTMSTRSFCDTYASHIDQALSMDQEKLRRWAQVVWPGQTVSERMCSAI